MNFRKLIISLVASVIPVMANAATIEYHSQIPKDADCADFAVFHTVVNFAIPQLKLGDGLEFSMLNLSHTLQAKPPKGLWVPTDGVSVRPPVKAEQIWISLNGGSGAENIFLELHDQRSLIPITIIADANSATFNSGSFGIEIHISDISVDNFQIFSTNNELGIQQICFVGSELR